MRDAQPATIYRKDYQPPSYLIDKTELQFDVREKETRVKSRLQLRRNPEADVASPLVLDGEELELIALSLDGRLLGSDDYLVNAESLTVASVPEHFVLECETRIYPQNNTSLEGLYKSSGMYCTQCEAEGFRKITYFIDRPDVMSVYTVSIEADRERYPVLLSNGNLLELVELEGGRQRAVWHDPFPKPSYLFALVAGKLSKISDRFSTCNGRTVDLHIYVEEKDIDKCDHAMDSLKRAMRWDEEVYGLEYDLDVFNIVAVDDFNMGAMENKSLNIFNTSCVLAKPETTTDAGFQRVEAVVAHEYFHNWSGNRVTCRDWFQLSLKEGFTVFRDACFSADMGSPTVRRVENVSLLRSAQFAEDAGPMAHPVRPDAFIEISNFYTLTIYEKGAEVVRMLHTLLGPELFRRGSDLYFERHDGQAVTCEDFVKAMEDVSGRDLQQFRRWYSQAGTPRLTIKGSYDAQARSYRLEVEQSCPPTPGETEKAPFHIPLAIGLLGEAGALRLKLAGESVGGESADNTHRVLDITEASQCFVFENVPEAPVPSLLRDFSAPVKLDFDYSRDQLMFLMRRDDDGFCRWDAAQQLGILALREMIDSGGGKGAPAIDGRLLAAYRSLLEDESLDAALVALMLQLPSEAYLTELMEPADVHAIHAARDSARQQVGEALFDLLLTTYRRLERRGDYQANAEQIAARSLRNVCLGYLSASGRSEALPLAVKQFETSDNMTDQLAALNVLASSDVDEPRERALADYYSRWRDEPLVVNQWFQVQAMCQRPGGLERVQALMRHDAFDLRNPNKVRALIGAFCNQNPVNFHRTDGAGYRFLVDRVLELNRLNPQIAARLLQPLTRWRKYLPDAQALMRAELQRLMAEPELSRDVYEVVSKSL